MSVMELDTLLRDSIALENAKSWRELEYVCRNIEARHKVEGISPVEKAAYENVKREHLLRVAVRIAV